MFAKVTLALCALAGICSSAAVKSRQTCQTIAEIAASNPDFSTLVTALTAADLADPLGDKAFGPITVFAPTNKAFAKVPKATLDSLLLPKNAAQLTNVLQYHVVEGKVPSSSLKNNQVVTMLNGDTTRVNLCANSRVTITGGSPTNIATVGPRDIQACNGIIHVIDTVLIPPQ